MKRIFTLLLFSLTALFINAQAITVTSPNGGETIYSCGTYNITWTSSGTSDYYDIEYSLDGGTIWASIATNYFSSTKVFAWTVPIITSSQCKVRVKDAQNTSTLDISDANFTIGGAIEVTSANGAETWQGGSTQTITWDNLGAGNRFNVYYSINGGSTWNNVVLNLNATSYSWTVPNNPSTNCKLKVEDKDQNCKFDVSDAVFTISPDDPILSTPNGGENIDAGCNYYIHWVAATFYSNIRIDYSLDAGATWIAIETNYSHTNGQYHWAVPDVQSTNCLVRVQDAVTPAVSDVSDAVFSINKPITIVNSNGGDTMQGGDIYVINWDLAVNSSNHFDIAYSINGGVSWSNVVNNLTSATGTYNWNVPNNPSTNCKFRVKDRYNTCKVDISDATFTILADDPLLYTPNGGETIDAGCVYNITWDASSFYSNIKIDYSLNGGSTWASIATNYYSGYGNYNWTVPENAISTNCLVRVQDAANPLLGDQSDAVFTINKPITLVNSNGGDTAKGGDNYTINWNTGAGSSNVFDIYYSRNNGSTWTQIANNYTSGTGTYIWAVPNTPSVNCKLKIRDINNTCKEDISDAPFTIIPDDPILTSPNGGESIDAGCYKVLTWNTSTFYSSVRIKYSLDGGAIWTDIVASYSNTGSYNWYVSAATNSTNCKIRIENATNSSEYDESDAVFTISPPITVVNSNGGDTTKGGDTYIINWTTNGSPSNTYDIFYTVNGSSWYYVVSNLTTTSGSYAWTVPNKPSTTCTIRVRDDNNICKVDESDANFTIIPDDPIITSPNGAEVVSAGCNKLITWQSSTFFSNVRIDYSLDNGLTWIQIIANTSNDGSHYWSVPSTTSTQALIRVSNISDVNIYDVSDAPFEIAPAITIINSNGGDTAIGCNTYTINWEKPGNCISYYRIYYSIDNGTSWPLVNNTVSNIGIDSTQSYDWTVPNDINVNTALFKVVDYYDASIFDISDANFTIIPSNDITITSPNGGEVFDAYSNQLITWTNLPGVSGSYTIQVSTNGASYSNIATNVTGNAYNWSVPKYPHSTYTIKVKDYNSSCRYDVSDADFTVNPPTPEIIYPNGNEKLNGGCSSNIRWNDSTFYENVRLEYSKDDGLTWFNIVTSTPNDGIYNWSLPHDYSEDYLIKASNVNDLILTDESDSTFTVRNPLNITTSNGGDTLVGCNTFRIQWGESSDCISRYKLYYTKNNGVTWIQIIYSLYTSGQYYDWTVPNNVNSTNCRFLVVDYYNSSVQDESDANFTILPSEEITVISPNGGETFQPDSVHLVTWSSLASTSGVFTVSYSSGGSYISAGTNIIGNAFNWTVPNNATSTYRIRVRDQNNSCKVDISDAFFTVDPLPPVLIFPNGGDTLDAACANQIRWDASTFYNNVRIDYSRDGGITWLNVISSTTNDGYHGWSPTTGVFGNNYKIKVSDATNLSLYDESDASFYVENPIKVLSSNGGDTLLGCSTFPIVFEKPSAACLNRFTIWYSLDGGGTWISIDNNQYVNNSNPTYTYNWSVPNDVNSSTVKFKIQGYSNPLIFDVSDANFTILPTNDITVTSPNGGEVFEAFSTQTITWTNTANVSGYYRVYFSSNGGSSYSYISGNITGNSFDWTVPNISAPNCKIKVRDYSNSCRSDESDLNFQITAQAPKLLTPNGGDSIIAGCPTLITWVDSIFDYQYVVLEFSDNNGLSWQSITTITANDGQHTWSPPRSSGATDFLVKVKQYNNYSKYDQSDSVFTLINPITNVTSSDTIVACTSVPITWNKPGSCISRFRLYYTYNNGNSWNDVTPSYINNSGTGNTQTYNWSVPSSIPEDSSIIIKVRDYYSTIVYEVSEPSILMPNEEITVTYPNGGEIYEADSTVLITWMNEPTTSGIYNVYYSSSAASGTIATNITGNATNWVVPNYPATNYKIKVRDKNNSCKEDLSDTTFIVTPNTPIFLFPNAGDTVTADCSTSIQWDNGTFYYYVRIEYSVNNGLTWIEIEDLTSNSGTYSWTPPISLVGTNYIIRVSHYNDLSISAQSDGPFVIKHPIKVISPAMGDTLMSCSTYPITWEKPSNCITYFRLYWSVDGGANYAYIAAVANIGTGNIQSYDFTVPNGHNRSDITFKVEDYYDNSVYDISDDVTIEESHTITLTTPNGGEIFAADDIVSINWTNEANVSGLYRVDYSVDGGSTFTYITGNIVGNSYNWTVPNIQSSNVKFKVRDQSSSCKFDVSDNIFEVTPRIPVVLTPNGGEIWYAKINKAITWDNTKYFSTYVRIDYSLDNGVSWNIIQSSTYNDGSYSWNVPNISSTQALIRISNFDDLNIYDVSDMVFELRPSVTVITPNGDNGITTWGGCTVTSITFDHTSAYNRWNIYYSLNNGASWNTIVSNWIESTNPATYNWTIPNTSSSDVKIKVEPYYASYYPDESDATFTVTQPVTLIQPNFGGIMQVGTPYTISWASTGISNLYNIDYSTNGGSTWSNIVTGYNTSTNTYGWSVPNTVSTNCKIRISDFIESCKEDISDVAFTISSTPPALTITNPNGGDTLDACNTYNILWNETSVHGNYDIAYSTNNGSSWNDIALNYATTSASYIWDVPNINTSNTLVRVKATGTAIQDLSDALFTIVDQHIEITTNDTTIYNSQSVQLNVIGGSTYSWTPISSLNNAGLSNPIASPTDTTMYTVQSIIGSCNISDSVLVNVIPVINAEATIAESINNICDGTNVTFTATVSNEGSSPIYQWFLNGTLVGSNMATYSSNTLSNNDEIYVVLTSNQIGLFNNIDTSNTITMNVTSNVTASVSFVSDNGSSICANTSTTFTASPINGGTATYQWLVNNANVGLNSNSFTTSSLVDNDQVKVIMTSDITCVLSNPASSTIMTMDVTADILASVSITSLGGNIICGSNTTTFVANPTNGGTSPTYQWKLNGVNVGTNNSTYATTTLVDNDVINCILTSNESCVSNNPITSNSIIMVVSTSINPSVIVTTPSTTICSGVSTTFTANPTNGGTSPIYQWKLNGVNIGTNSASFISSTIADSDTISVLLTSNASCLDTAVALSNSVVLTVSNIPSQPTSISGDVTVCNGENKTYTTPTVSGATSYTWTLPLGWSGTSNTNSISVVTGSTSGNISVLATNSCGNSLTQILSVSSNTDPTVIANTTETIICSGDSITLTGTGASSYSWDNSAINGNAFAPSINTTYTVTGTDVNGCTATDQVTITVNSLPTVTANADNSSICIGSSVTLNGSGADTYIWDSGVTNNVAFNSMTVGTITYTVEGTDVNGCVGIDDIDVGTYEVPTINGGSDVVICLGDTVTLNASGASTYTWNNGISNNVAFVPTSSGTYIVTGSIGNCNGYDTVNVTVNSAPTISVSSTSNAVCLGNNVTLTASGANTYSWNNGITNGTAFSPTSTLTYIVTGTGTNTCTTTANYTVTVNTLPTVTASADDTDFCLGEDVTLSGSGANTYTWDGGATNNVPLATTLGTVTYTVIGTDINGCIGTDDIDINATELPNVIAGNDTSICNNSALTLSGIGASTYSWNNGITNATSFNVTSSTIYTVTGTDIFGCTNTDNVTVSALAVPTVTAVASDNSICIGDGVILQGTGTSSGNGYVWDNGVTDNTSFVPSTTTTYTVSNSYTYGSLSCSASDQITVAVNNLPTVNAGIDFSSCENDLVTLNGSGANSYSWDNGKTDNVPFSLSATNTFTVTGTDVNGCSNTDDITITTLALPTVSAGNDTTVCINNLVTLNGSGANTYSWNNGISNGLAFIAASDATYTLTGTATNGCSSTDNVNVTTIPLPTVVANATSISICTGEMVTLTGSGAVTYAWDNGVIDGVAFSPSTTGTYTVVGTNANGCTSTDQITVTVTNSITVFAGNDMTVCQNSTVTLAGSGASSYSWDNGVIDNTSFTSLTTTTYTVVGTDPNGCTDSDVITITVNTSPTVVANSSSASVCNGDAVTLTGSGANSYSWDLGVTDNVSFSPSTSLTYTVTGTDVNMCTNTDQITVNINALPTVVANTTDNSVCDGNNIVLSGAGASTYSWDNGVINNTSFTPTSSTNYTVTGTDANGCSNTDMVSISVNTNPTVDAGLDMIKCVNASVTLSGSGAVNYSWDNGVNNNIAFTLTSSNTYSVTGTDANGCTGTDAVIVTMDAIPTVVANANTSSLCNGDTLTLTGTGADSYSWDYGVTDGVSFIPSSTITYSVTGTTTNGCTNTDQVTVSLNTIPTVVANTTDNNVCDGESIILTGSGADTYTWDNSALDNNSFVPTATQTYSVTGTDASGCSNTANVLITVNSLPIVDAGLPQNVCQNTLVSLSGSGANTYTWNNGVTNNVQFAATATTIYTATGTDLNGCTDTDNVIVIVNATASVTATSTDTEICAGEAITLTGTSSATVAWDNGVSDNVAFTPTATTTYTVTADNGNGCLSNDDITVIVNSLPSVFGATTSNSVCEGETITLTGSGADTYSWNNSAMDNVAFAPTSSFVYTVTGTDANNCTNTADVSITVKTKPTVYAGTDTVVCQNETIMLSGSGADSYNWDNGAINNLAFSVNASNTYTVIGTSANGCSNTDNLVVSVVSLPIVIASSSPSVICAGKQVVLTGSGADSYTWNNSVVDNVGFNPTTTNSYTVIGTDINGCESSSSITVPVNPRPTVIVSQQQDEINGGDGFIEITVSSGTPTYTFDWDNDGTGDYDDYEDQYNLSTGTYNVVVLDANGCETSTKATIEAPIVSIDDINNELNEVTLYPNPNQGVFKLLIGKVQNEDIVVEVFDINGKILITKTIESLESELLLDLRNISSGQYFMHLSTMKFKTVRKFTILK